MRKTIGEGQDGCGCLIKLLTFDLTLQANIHKHNTPLQEEFPQLIVNNTAAEHSQVYQKILSRDLAQKHCKAQRNASLRLKVPANDPVP